jgi:hypothetical protein
MAPVKPATISMQHRREPVVYAKSRPPVHLPRWVSTDTRQANAAVRKWED